MRSVTAQRITGVAVAVALMAAAAQLAIPLPFLVPVTLQVPVMLAAGLILGPYTAAAAMAVYIAAGLAGLPVFTSFGGGPAYIFRPSFGFLIGFIPASLLAGILCSKEKRASLLRRDDGRRPGFEPEKRFTRFCGSYIRLALPVLALYAAGLSYQYFVLRAFNGFSPQTAITAVTASLGIFLAADAVKIILVALAYERLAYLRRFTLQRA